LKLSKINPRKVDLYLELKDKGKKNKKNIKKKLNVIYINKNKNFK
jgi:hypothetical protein